MGTFSNGASLAVVAVAAMVGPIAWVSTLFLRKLKATSRRIATSLPSGISCNLFMKDVKFWAPGDKPSFPKTTRLDLESCISINSSFSPNANVTVEHHKRDTRHSGNTHYE